VFDKSLATFYEDAIRNLQRNLQNVEYALVKLGRPRIACTGTLHDTQRRVKTEIAVSRQTFYSVREGEKISRS
jgi:hypothetical protein